VQIGCKLGDTWPKNYILQSHQFQINMPVVPREKIYDDFSETTKLLISFGRIMLELETKSQIIENYLLYKID
jgi:hypothetical protein